MVSKNSPPLPSVNNPPFLNYFPQNPAFLKGPLFSEDFRRTWLLIYYLEVVWLVLYTQKM